jgi:hypothetical protein
VIERNLIVAVRWSRLSEQIFYLDGCTAILRMKKAPPERGPYATGRR